MPVGLITGGSRGLGRAIAAELVVRGWTVVVNGRDSRALSLVAQELGDSVVAVPGDVAEPRHRSALAEVVCRLGPLDLLVNNASALGPSPLPPLDRYPTTELESVLRVNVVAPVALIQRLMAVFSNQAVIVNISSDAAVEAYPGWGAYGASKAALDRISAVLAAEHLELAVYAFDPGDMRTAMHQAAYPGEDISDRPEPETVVPALLRLIEERLPSGRYRASELLVGAAR